jgi:CHASE3 domain sensor protein
MRKHSQVKISDAQTIEREIWDTREERAELEMVNRYISENSVRLLKFAINQTGDSAVLFPYQTINDLILEQTDDISKRARNNRSLTASEMMAIWKPFEDRNAEAVKALVSSEEGRQHLEHSRSYNQKIISSHNKRYPVQITRPKTDEDGTKP